MVIGNLATATRVAILVPGSDTTLATFFSRGPASPGGGAEALAAQARRLEPAGPGERLAVIAWLGYPAPAMLSPGVMTSGAGRQSGDSIRFVPHVQLFGLGFGADPMSNGFGAHIFATGDSGHSGYLDPGSVSLRNLTYIALGDPAAVTR